MAITLESVSRRFVSRSEDCLQAYSDALVAAAPRCLPLHEYAKERVILDLHDKWVQFMREFFIVSACRKPMTSVGRRLTYSAGTVEALLRAIRVADGKNPTSGWTPRWHYPRDMIRFAQSVKLENEPLIAGVLSDARADALNDLTVVRNYVAHRNRSAVRMYSEFVKRVAVPPGIRPSALIDDRAYYGSAMLEHWVAVLQFLASSLA